MKIMGKRALIVIDYTNDFVADEGALTCGKPGQDIQQEIVNLTKSFIENGDYVVFATDIHYENDPYHPETKLFPPHNIAGTKGRHLYGELQSVWEINKNNENVYFMDKTRYSAFAGTDLDIRLKERGIEELHFCGVCTDICCLHSIVSAYNLGYNIVAHSKGMASFNEDGHKWALDHFKGSIGAVIV